MSEYILKHYQLPNVKGQGWADIIILRGEKGGQLFTITDYGNYNYGWWSIGGDGDLRRFIVDADKYYLTNKLANGTKGYSGFQLEESIKRIKEALIERLRDLKYLVKSQYKKEKSKIREDWDALEEISCEFEMNKFIENCNLQEAYEYVKHGYSASVKCFRDETIPRLQELLKDELDKEKESDQIGK